MADRPWTLILFEVLQQDRMSARVPRQNVKHFLTAVAAEPHDADRDR
jgi:hypothetical protein